MNITDKIKTIGDAYAAVGVTESEVIPYAEPKDGVQKSINAFAKLIFIAKALNEGWEPNWGNSSEYKYYPWFWMESEAAGGSGFSCYGYDCDYVRSGVAPRLVFKTSQLAKYAGTQFLEIYKEYMVIE